VARRTGARSDPLRLAGSSRAGCVRVIVMIASLLGNGLEVSRLRRGHRTSRDLPRVVEASQSQGSAGTGTGPSR
jgi:hypothetical protein